MYALLCSQGGWECEVYRYYNVFWEIINLPDLQIIYHGFWYMITDNYKFWNPQLLNLLPTSYLKITFWLSQCFWRSVLLFADWTINPAMAIHLLFVSLFHSFSTQKEKFFKKSSRHPSLKKARKTKMRHLYPYFAPQW